MQLNADLNTVRSECLVSPGPADTVSAKTYRWGPLWAGTGHPVGHTEACKVKIFVSHRRKSALSPC